MLGRTRRRSFRADASGQGLVEFALVLPILLVIMLGIIQFGWILTSQIGLTNAIREAARYAATNPTVSVAQATTNEASTLTQLTTILPRNVNFYSASNLAGSSPTVSYCEYRDPSNRFSVRVTVTVEYRHPLFIPLISSILDGIDGSADNALRVGAVEQMRVENSTLRTNSTGIPSC